MKRLLAIAAVLHLAAIASGLFPSLGRTPLGPFLNRYARLTGAGSNFGFFAPDVGNQLTIRFLATDSRQRVTEVDLRRLVTRDTSVRLGNMYRFFTQVYQYPRIRRSVAASLSSHVFERMPDATSVTFEADYFGLPGMSEYRRDRKIFRKPVYRATFQRGVRATTASR